MSSRAPDRGDVQAKLVAALLRHGVVIKLVTGRMVVHRYGSIDGDAYMWFWYGDAAGDSQASDDYVRGPMAVYVLANVVLEQCGTRAVLAALEGEGG